MGMAASQARLLFITSRMNDIEMKTQQIANSKMRLASESEQVANDYTAALNKTKFVYYDPVNNAQMPLNYNTMMDPGGSLNGVYSVKTSDGKVVVSKSVASAFETSNSVSSFLAKFGITGSSASVEDKTTELRNTRNTRYSSWQAAKGQVEKFLNDNNLDVDRNGKVYFKTNSSSTGGTSTVNTTESSSSVSGSGGSGNSGSVKTTESTSSTGGSSGTGNIPTIESTSSTSGSGRSNAPSRAPARTVSTVESTSSTVGGSGGGPTGVTTGTGSTSGTGNTGRTATVNTVESVSSTGGTGGTTGTGGSKGSGSVNTTESTSSAGGTGGSAALSALQSQYDVLVGIEKERYNSYLEADYALQNYKAPSASQQVSADVFYTNLYNEMSKGYQAYDSSMLNNRDAFCNMIQNGAWVICQNKNDGNGYQQISLSSSTGISEVSDKDGFAKAEAEYNAKTAKINKKEKILDMKLKNLDTEHSALKTEYDSEKSLISENVEKSFNLFS